MVFKQSWVRILYGLIYLINYQKIKEEEEDYFTWIGKESFTSNLSNHNCGGVKWLFSVARSIFISQKIKYKIRNN
jgi:hypothetical protein